MKTENKTTNLQPWHYFSIVAIGLAYLGLQFVYLLHLPLAPDEFHFLHKLRELHFRAPYSEIYPYKTLLGQYFQGFLLSWITDEWTAISYIKLQNAIAVVVVFTWVFFYLRKIFKPEALLLSLALLFATSTFLERSAELRVDMLTSLAGLVGFCFLLNRRLLLAGIFAGLSFLVSQKGIYYCIASALAVLFLSLAFKEEKEFLKKAKIFFIALLYPIVIYIIYWSLRASFLDVFEMTFLRHLQLVFADIYGFFSRYWRQTLFRNPIFYLLSVSSIALLLAKIRRQKADYRELTLFFYGSFVLLLSALHKQPWPYFFVILLPTLFLLNTYALERWKELALSQPFRRSCLLIFLVFGFFYPLMRVQVVLARENNFQREMLKVAKLILKENETYFAGFDFLMAHQQSTYRFAWLDREKLGELVFKSKQETRRLVAKLKNNPGKFLLANYRLNKLSRQYQDFFSANYVHYYGNIYIYAPRVEPEENGFMLNYPGWYEVEAKDLAPEGEEAIEIVFDKKPYALGEKLFLEKGWHRIKTDTPLQFILQPEIEKSLLKLEFAQPRKFFDQVYDY